MIHRIQHTAMSTPDMERALAFYRDLLGFRVVSDFVLDGLESADRVLDVGPVKSRVVMLMLEQTALELFEFTAPQPAPSDPERPVCNHGITHICLDVTGIDAEYERLSAAGMRFHCPPQRMGQISATYGRDPDGNVVELYDGPRPGT
jgi:catechol 2,3-dioxygenase-like lactoylglutathione lyase family enzyme